MNIFRNIIPFSYDNIEKFLVFIELYMYDSIERIVGDDKSISTVA